LRQVAKKQIPCLIGSPNKYSHKEAYWESCRLEAKQFWSLVKLT